MLRTTIVALTLVFSTAALADHDRGGPQPDTAVSREKLNRKLSKLNDMLTSSIGRAPNRQFADELRAIRAEVDELRDYVSRAQSLSAQPQLPPQQQQQGNAVFLPPPQMGPQPVTPQQLSALISAINREAFSDGKVRVLQTAVQSQFFLIGQVKQVLNAYPFSKDKLTAVALMEPRIMDSQNEFQLYDSFVHPSDKAALRKILEDRPRGNGPRRMAGR